MSPLDADLAILGGGLAGLSLGRQLAMLPHPPRTVILEPRGEYHDDRTWCFWSRERADLAPLIHAAWPRWRFSSGEREIVREVGDGVAYRCIRAGDFYRTARADIAGREALTLRLDTRVESLHPATWGVTVDTDAGRLRVRHVVDTRPPDPARRQAVTLAQVFSGVEVRTDEPCFEATTVGLMEAMASDDLGFRFLYILPFSSTHALVEETRFSALPVPAERLAADLERAVEQLTGGLLFVPDRWEAGWIPMGLPDAPAPPGVVRAGTGGGAVRAATGYAFLRIQRWSRDCAARLARGEPPVGHPPEPGWRRGMDELFLRVLRRHPQRGPALFMALARGVPAAGLVRFLSDEARPRDLWRVMRALPAGLFLRELAARG